MASAVAQSGQLVREELLLTMYRSVIRMNEHILEGRMESAGVEMHLQKNLRKNFVQLEHGSK